MDDGQTSEKHIKLTMPWRIRIGLILSAVGLFIFILGARPSVFGLDRSPIVGFVQIITFLVGLGIICIGGYVSLVSLWGKEPRTIKADIGLRLVSTGFVMAVFSGLTDVFGFGSHPLPGTPYFGPWQARGVEFGQLLIGIGFLLLLPIHRKFKTKEKSRI
jgi:hypothetical protein